MSESREWTQEEVQAMFMEYMASLVEYWLNESRAETAREKMDGLLFSLFTTLDGCGNLPAFEIIPSPHPDDKRHAIENGENYFRPFDLPADAVTVHGGSMLHDLIHKYLRKR